MPLRWLTLLLLLAAAIVAVASLGSTTTPDGLEAVPTADRWMVRDQPAFTLRDAKAAGRADSDKLVRHGARPDQATTFPVDLDSSVRVGYRSLGITTDETTVLPHGMLYRTPEFDIVRTATVNRIQEFTTVHARQGVRTWRWELISTDGTDPRLHEDGSIGWDNGAVIAPPVIYDGAGTPIDTDHRWKLEGSVLSLRVDDSSYPLPYVVDPDGTNPISRFEAFTEVNPGVDPTDGTYRPGGDNIIVSNMVPGGPQFSVRFRAYDTVANGDPTYGGVAGLQQVEWGAIPAARGTWLPAAGNTAAAPSGLQLRCWDTPNPGANGTEWALANDNAIDYNTVAESPDRNPNLPWAITRTSPTVTYDGGDPNNIASMSCRWSGFIVAQNTRNGNYQFQGFSDDGFRANIDNQGTTGVAGWPTLNDWTPHAARTTGPNGTINFGNDEAKPLVVEWYENVSNAAAELRWNPQASGWVPVPEGAYVEDIFYDRTYTAAFGGGGNGTSSIDVVARDLVNRTSPTGAAPGRFQVTTDNSSPWPATGFTTNPLPGWRTNASIAISVTDGSGDVGAAGVHSRYLQRQFVPIDPATNDCGLVPGPWVNIGGPWTNNATRNVTDGPTLADGCYQYRYVSVDRVNNDTIDLPSSPGWIKIDRTLPASLVFNGFTEDVSPDYQYSVGSQMWFNPTFPGTFSVAFDATDVGRGMDRVIFPDVDGAGTGFTPAGSTDTDDIASPYTATFSWAMGSTSTGLQTVQGYDLNNNGPINGTYTVTSDASAPTGGTLAVLNHTTGLPIANGGYYSGNTRIRISNPAGTPFADVGSGLRSGAGRVRRREAPLSGGNCGGFTVFTDVSSNITVPASGASFDFEDTSTANGFCYEYQYYVPDNVNNYHALQTPTTTVVRKDNVAPTGAINVPTENPGSGTVLISGSSADAHSGIDYVRVTYVGPSTSGNWCAAGPPGPPLSSGNWSCTVDTALFPDGTYTIFLTAYDFAGNASPVYTRTLVLDNQPPVVSSIQFVENISPASQYANNCTLPCVPEIFFNPALSGSFFIDVTASDSGTGVGNVTYPDIDGAAAAWSPAGGADGGAPYSLEFSWTGPGATADPFLYINTFDVAGAMRTDPIAVTPDSTPPAGASITNPSPSATKVLSVPISFVAGNDGVGSGIASTVIERQSATLSGGTCGGFGAWTPVTLVSGADTSVLTSQCYQYRVLVTDRVGNNLLTDGDPATNPPTTTPVRVDTINPNGSITAPLVSTWAGTVNIAGTAGDAHSGVAGITVTYAGPVSGTIAACNAISVATWNSGCGWDTTNPALSPDGAYVVTATVTDIAGNTFAITRNVTIDNTAPVMGFVDFVEGSQSQYQARDLNLAANLHWYNPAFSGDFVVQVDANDMGGTGVANVTYPSFGGLWSNPGGLVDNTAPAPYSIQYNWAAGAIEPGTVNATGTDNAGKSATQTFSVRADAGLPSGGTLSVPNGAISTTTATITFNEGLDAESGVGGWRLMRASSTMTGGTCPAVGVYTTVASKPTTGSFVDTLADGQCYQYKLEVDDRVLNTRTYNSGSIIKVDDTDPSGTINGAPPSPFGNTVVLTGNATDGQTGPSTIQLTYSGASSGTVCSGATPLAGPFPATSSAWSCNWDTTVGVPDGVYTLNLQVTDGAGNVSLVNSIQRTSIVVDNTPPTIGPATFTEVTGAQYQHPVGTLLWYNPAFTGSVTVSTPATDLGTGVNRVQFPTLPTAWGPAGGPDSSSPYEVTYSWGLTSTEPGPQTLTAFDNAGKSSTTGFTIRQDTTPPGGGGITVVDGIVGGTTPSTSISFSNGSDAESGIVAANRQLYRSEATYANGACGSYSVPATIGPAGPTSPYLDSTIQDGKCYQYQLVERDNVNNQFAYTSVSQVRVDGTPPTGSVALLPAGPWSGTVGVNGNAGDTASGVDRVRVTYSGPASGTICNSPSLSAAPDPRLWGAPACNWNTNPGPALPDGLYDIQLQVWDLAGNTFMAPIRQVTVDNNPPTLNTLTYVEGANTGAQHAVGSTMFYNPLQAGGFTVRFTAADPGTGVANVTYPSLGAGWNPAGGVVNAAPYEMGYTWSASPNAPGTRTAVAFDNAGNFSAAPIGNFTITPDAAAPVGTGITVTPAVQQTTSTSIAYVLGADGAGSGIGSWNLERRTSPYVSGNCTAFTGWSPIGGTSPPSPYVDNSLVSGVCYEYQIIVRDNVGNPTTANDADQVRVDDGNPNGAISPTPAGPISGNGNSISGTATDAESGVASVTVTFQNGATTGTMCLNQAVVAGGWTCSFDTNPGPALPDGTYTLTLTVLDNAGNTSTATRTIVVDNLGPVISAVTLNEAGGNNFLHNIGSTMYFNPTGGGVVRVDVTATDAGAGMDRVTYPSFLLGPWSGGGDDTSVPYQMPYTWTAHAVGTASPNAQVLIAKDLAGNTSTANFSVVEDAIAPTGVSITYATQTTGVSPVVIGFAPGSDSASQLQDWRIQRDSAPFSGGTCGAWTGWNVGVASPPGATYSDATVADGFCYRYRITSRDNVDNSTTVTGTDVVRFDNTAPGGSISGTPTGPSSGNVTFTGTGTDLGSGVQSVKVDFAGTPTGPTGNICTSPTLGGTASAATWSCLWNTTSPARPDGVYTITLTVTDAAGNVSAPIQRTITIDNNPPTVTFKNFTTGTNPNYQHIGAGSTIFYNPTFGGSFNVLIDVTDPGTGPAGVQYTDPDGAGAGWSLANGGLVGPAAAPGTATYSNTLTWTAAAAQPGLQQATGFDVAGGSAQASYTVLADSLDPTGGAITYLTQFTNAANVSIGYTIGADGTGSGVKSHEMWRQQSVLSGGTCSATWSAFGPVGGPSPAIPFVDTTTQNGFCYRYELHVTDNVGNVAEYTGTNDIKIDRLAPNGSVDSNPVGPVSGPITVGWTSTDGESGVANVALTWENTLTLATGPICGSQPATGTCPWNTSALPEGTYRIIAVITDNATNSRTVDRTIVIDNTPPTVSFKDFVEGTNPNNQFWAGGASDPMYYNPALTGSFTARFNAADLGSGMSGVTFPSFGAGWNPAGGAGTPGAPPLYFFTYDWTGPGAATPGTQLVTAFDIAGSSAQAGFNVLPDSSTPTGGTISSPIPIQTGTSYPVAFNVGSDTGSQVGSWRIDRRSTAYANNICNAGWGVWGQISTATAPWPTSPYTDSSLTDSRCYEYRLTVVDNVGNASTVYAAQSTRVDQTNPIGDITAPAAGAQVGGNAVGISGTATDVGSGVQYVNVTFTGGAFTNAPICVNMPFNGVGNWNCGWDTTSLPDGSYTINLEVVDAAGRTSAIVTRAVTVDNQPPSVVFESFIESSGAQYTHWTGLPSNKIYVNTNQTPSFQTRFTVADGGTGASRLDFPALGTGWDPLVTSNVFAAPAGQASVVLGLLYTIATAPAANPGLQTVTGFDVAGNSATANFNVEADITPPNGGSLTVPNVTTKAASVTISHGASADGQSGPGTRLLQRREGPFSAGTCAAPIGSNPLPPAGWATIATDPVAAYADGALVSGRCYEYRLLVNDNVGNVQTITSGNVVRIDRQDPDGTIDAAPNDPFSGSVVITGVASDALSGVEHVDITWRNTTTLATGNVCLNPAITLGAWSCPSWATTALPDGTYELSLTVHDNATNSRVTHTRTVIIDNNPPLVEFSSFLELAGFQYQHINPSDPSILFFNPAQTGRVQVRFHAEDGGTGMQRVDFPAFGTTWTPGTVTSDTTSSGPTWIWETDYEWTSGAGAPGLQNGVGYDIAGNSLSDSFEIVADTAAPSGGSLTVPSVIISTTSVSISFTTGTDSLSGLASAQLQQRSGTYANGVCEANYGLWSAWTNVGPSAPATASPISATGLTGGLCYEFQRVVTDNVGNPQVVSSANQVKVDTAQPNGTFTAPADLAQVGGSAVVVNGTANDTHSGVHHVDVTWANALLGTSGNVCLSAPLSPPPGVRTWSCPPWDASLLPDGTYTLTLTVHDNATPANTFTVTRTVTVDNDPPALAFTDFQEQVGAGFQHPDPVTANARLFVNPASTGQVRVRFTSTDAGTGVAGVAFPAIGGGWSPAGGTGTPGASNTYGFVYDWTNPAVGSGLQTVTSTDNAGNSRTASFEIELDSTDPAGGSITVTNQIAPLLAGIPVTIAPATDSQSGLGTTQLQRRSTAYAGNVCDPGTWTVFADVGPANPGASWTDAGISNATCYEYQVVFTDNVGNSNVVGNTSTVRVDRTTPFGSFTTPAAGGQVGGVAVVSGTSSDVHSGVQTVDVTWTGPSATSGNVCLGTSPTDPWSCNWTTPAIDGPYQLTLKVTDRAGNVFTDVRNVVVDNLPPAVTFTSFNQLTGAQYQHVDAGQANKLWFNPTQAGTFELIIGATDTGTGMNRVDFPQIGTGWTPGTPTVNNTPAPVGTYTLQYGWAAAAASPGPRQVTGVDNAGNSATAAFEVEADSNPPTGGSITVPNVITSSTSVVIPFTASSDSASGVATGQFERRQAVYANGVCPDFAVTPGAWSSFSAVGASTLVGPSFTDATVVSGFCYEYRRVVTDNVGNPHVIGSTNQVRVDTSAPNGDFDPNPVGPVSGNGVPISGWATDGISGVSNVVVTFTRIGAGTGPATGTICTNPPLTAVPDPRLWTCLWDTTGMEGTYNLELMVYDLATPPNSAGPITRGIVVDNQAPVIAFDHFTSSINPGAMYFAPAPSPKIFINPALTGRFQVNFTASDGGTGMDRVDFPSAGAGWNTGGSHVSSGPNFVYDYDWTSGATGTGLQVVTARDAAGNTATSNFEIEHDTTAPSGGSITVPNIITNVLSQPIGLTLPTDAQSGNGLAQVWRSSTTFLGGTCNAGSWTVYAPVGPANPGTTWNDTTLAGATCYRYEVRFSDRVGNTVVRSSPSELRVDTAIPLATITPQPASVSGVITIDGTSSDVHSGVQSVLVEMTDGTSTVTVCTAVPTNPWSCPYDTSTLAQGTWTIRTTVTDRAGNFVIVTEDVIVDNTPPSATFKDFAEMANGQYMHAIGTTLYVNPAFSGTVRPRIDAVDTGTDMRDVSFPIFPPAITGWSGGGVDAIGTSDIWFGEYTWTGPGAVEPGTQFARATDNAGNFIDVEFRIENDSTNPTGGSIAPLNVTTDAADHTFTWTQGTDSQSLVATRQFQRESSPFSGGTCTGPWTAWANVGTTSPATPFVDSTTVDATCYRYRQLVTDNVGNVQTISNTNNFRVDRIDPIGIIDSTPNDPWSGTQIVTGSSSDATSGIQSVVITYAGLGPVAANTGTLSTCSGTTSWSCTWDTAALGAASDGSYVITLLTTDNAGNTHTITRTVVIDNNPPVTTFVGFIEGTNGGNQHAVGGVVAPIMYYNPLLTGSFRVQVKALDAGVGVNRVDFPGYGAGWIPTAGPNSDNTHAGDFVFEQAYSWTASPTNPSLKTATSFDNAGNSASVSWTVTPDPAGPTALSVSYPDGDFTGTDVAVTFSQGTDVLSGISDWRLQRAVQPYTNMVCGSGALPLDVDYVNVGGASPGSPYTDAGVPNGSCLYYRIRSVDNVGNVSIQSSTDAVQVDQTDPWGQIDAAPAGPIGGNTNAITGLASDGQSGLEHVDVTWTSPNGTTGDICLAPGLTPGALPSDPSTWSCNWNTTATPEDGLYTITLTVEDNAGNTFVTSRQVIIDNLPPAPGALVWVPQTNVTAQYATGSTLFFNPAQTGTVRARIVACDQNGITDVTFPGIAAGWTPPGGDPALKDTIPSNPAVCGADPGGEFDVTYTFTSPASAPPLPGNVTVVATDSSANTSTRTGTVLADPTAPTGGSIGYVPQTINVPTTLGINFSVGSDNAGGSGLRGHRLERDTAPLLGNACGTYTGTWTQTGPNNPVAGMTDTGLADQTCYRYRLVVTDNVGNQAIYTDPQNDEIKSDRTLPTGTIDVPIAMAMVSGNAVTVSGTSGDAHTAIDHITLDWIGPSGGPLTACAGLTPAPVTGDWTCSWDTIGLIDGQYTLIFTVFDLAGNQNTITRTVVVDNLAPTIGPLQFAEGTNPGYQHANGTRMYFNSLFGGSFDVQVQSSDGGTGVANLTFPSLGGSWGAPAPAVQTVGTPYNSTYTWVAGSPSTAAPVTVTSTDNAGNSSTITFEAIQDATPPVSGTVTYADAWVSGSTQLVGFAVGSDAGSGIRTWKLQRRSATLGAGTCGAYGVWGDIGAADPTAAVLDTGLADATCYQWQLMVVDNVGHEAYFTSTNAVKIDRTAPDGAILPAPPSPWSGTQTISATTTDVGSGVASAALSFTGPMSGSICTEISAPSSFGCTWDTTTVTDGTYVLTLAVRDRANNPNALPIQRTVVVDNNGPTFSFDHFTEGAGALFQFIDTTPVGDDILYVNPGVGASGGFRVHFQATDGGSGMQRVDFPGIGANWAPVGGGPDTDTTDSEFIFDYSWNTGAVEPLVQTATAWDLANNTSTDVFEIRHDTGVPIGGTVNTPNVLTSSAGANITWTPATDALTGMRGHQLQRRSATYALGVCGAFGGWTNIGIVDQPSPFNDTTVLDGNCYQYQLVATDNVSNFAVFSDADAVRIDSTPPTGTIDPAVPAAPWSGTVNVIGTASDSGSGVVDIDLGWISPSTGPLCQDMTAASWTCTFDTTTVPDGTYTFNLVVRDAAGNVNVAPITRTVLIDNNGPIMTLPAWSEQANPQYQYVDPIDQTLLWVNPIQTGTARLTVGATDGGSGMDFLRFPALGTGWNPPTDTDDSSVSPYFLDYPFSPGAVPGIHAARAFDVAGNSSFEDFEVRVDSTPPISGAVGYTDGFTNTLSTTVTLTLGADGGGVGVGGHRLIRTQAPLSGSLCGVYGTPTQVGGASPTSPYSDPTLANGFCYRYQLITVDHVGNEASWTSSNEVKVDDVRPTGTIDLPPTYVSGTATFTGTSADAGSGVAGVTLSYTGPGTVPNCVNPAPAFTPTWSCGIDTTTMTDGTYTLTLVVVDRATNTSVPVTQTIIVDNAPPSILFANWSETTNGEYTHPVGTRMYYKSNAAVGAIFQLRVDSTDSSGVANVAFPALGTGWTPNTVQTVTGGPQYSGTFEYAPGASIPGPQNVLSTDNAGNSA
ncbi:MAG: hypothetical protein JWM90_2754, partial [Thermoleophilia bacterium]|nr:hypothetical protein [Thermoleophilia bacterium]